MQADGNDEPEDCNVVDEDTPLPDFIAEPAPDARRPSTTALSCSTLAHHDYQRHKWDEDGLFVYLKGKEEE